MMKIETLKQLQREKKKLKAECAAYEEKLKLQYEYIQDNASEMAAYGIENVIAKFSIIRFIKRFFSKDDSFGIGSLFGEEKGNKFLQLALTAGLGFGMKYFKKWFSKE